MPEIVKMRLLPASETTHLRMTDAIQAPLGVGDGRVGDVIGSHGWFLEAHEANAFEPIALHVVAVFEFLGAFCFTGWTSIIPPSGPMSVN